MFFRLISIDQDRCGTVWQPQKDSSARITTVQFCSCHPQCCWILLVIVMIIVGHGFLGGGLLWFQYHSNNYPSAQLPTKHKKIASRFVFVFVSSRHTLQPWWISIHSFQTNWWKKIKSKYFYTDEVDGQRSIHTKDVVNVNRCLLSLVWCSCWYVCLWLLFYTTNCVSLFCFCFRNSDTNWAGGAYKNWAYSSERV